MALALGIPAPDIQLASTTNKTFSLRDFKGQALILFFYPKDFTKGCTAEACEFRDQFSEFRNMAVPVFGISRDDIPTHERFKQAYQLPFDLLSDPEGKICKAYDALIPLIKLPKRVTYLLDKDHRIAGVFEGLFENKKHVSAMIAKLEKA